MTERRKRIAPKKEIEEPTKPPRKWSEDELKVLLDCLQKHGHKNYPILEKCLPHRSIENIKSFMRTLYATATKMSKGHKNLDFWIKLCSNEVAPWSDSIQIAQVIKYLSVDGLLENHPLPEHSQGVDFRQAYRFIYQALMGYPIQPVNQETADFIIETLAELNNEMKKDADIIQNLSEFLNKAEDDISTKIEIKTELDTVGGEPPRKKALKVYERKKLKSQMPEEAPSLKIVIEESRNSNCNLGPSKSFSVTVEGGDSSQATIVDVPVAVEKTVDVDEENLLKSATYNPLRIPSKWLEEPLALNLKQKP